MPPTRVPPGESYNDIMAIWLMPGRNSGFTVPDSEVPGVYRARYWIYPRYDHTDSGLVAEPAPEAPSVSNEFTIGAIVMRVRRPAVFRVVRYARARARAFRVRGGFACADDPM